MPLATPDPPSDLQVPGIIGGIVGAAYCFYKMVKAWPLRESNGSSKKALLARLAKCEARMDSLEGQSKLIEKAVVDSHWQLDQKLDRMGDRIAALSRRFEGWRDGC